MGVLYTQALADRAQAWLERPLTAGTEGKRSNDGLLELASIWAAINRLPLPNCIRQCQYSERCADIQHYLRDFSRLQHPETMSESTYQFAPQFANETLTHDSYNKVVTADNLTDDDVKFFTEKGRKDLFVKKGEAATTPEVGDKTTPDAKGAEALKAEKEVHKAEKKAHAETKKQLSEVEKQLTEAQKQLAEIAEKAKDQPDTSTSPAAVLPA